VLVCCATGTPKRSRLLSSLSFCDIRTVNLFSSAHHADNDGMMRCVLLCLLVVAVGAGVATMPVQNRQRLARLVAEVSDPAHHRYLRHLSADELHASFAPSDAQLGAWFVGNYSLVQGRRWQVEHPSIATPAAATRRRVHRFQGGADALEGVEVVVGATLASVYNFTDRAALANPLRIAIVSEGDQYLASDLVAFQAITRLTSANYSQVDAALSSAGAESTLDVEAVLLTAPAGVQVQFVYSTPSFNSWCTYILNLPAAQWPDVVSLSWGETEIAGDSDEEALDDCLQLLALGGVSVVVATGDNGASGADNPQCSACDGFIPAYPSTSAFVTAVGATGFAAATGTTTGGAAPLCTAATIGALCQAYNISAGAFAQYSSDSFFCLKGALAGSEQAVSLDDDGFFGGGGFSTAWQRPSWQSAAVQAYYASAPAVPFPPPTYLSGCQAGDARPLWSPAMRGFPDVSMYGAGVVLVKGAALQYEGGTSLSAPLFAGALGHVVDWFKSHHNGSRPGLLGPLLYSLAGSAAFNDVTVGTNNGTETNEPATCPLGGFTAAPGWDAVTGLGTPNIGMLIHQLSLSLASSSSSSSSSSTGRAQGTSAPMPTTVPQSTSAGNNGDTAGQGGYGSSSSSSGLPTWAIAVISVVGSLVGVVLIAFLVSSVLRPSR
jgi:subtilase family serine protease